VIAAVFDLDGTLLPETTAERLFVRMLIRERVLGVGALLHTIRFLAVEGRVNPLLEARRHRPYLRGQDVALLAELGARCVDEVVAPRLSCRGIAALARHRQLGHTILLLSGSLPYVGEPIARLLSVDALVCSELDMCDGRLTGRLRGLHPYGGAKALLVRRFARDNGVDLDRSFCYADHHADAQMLSQFGNPICVNPDRHLEAIAGSRGWAVERFA
jgi:putative phosphoserine phosphatase/1-acylglycerol-3-phosphate O-acyltransferase